MRDEERRAALADFLRTRRARISPLDVGLSPGRRRRTPGLRREEVAQLAHIGVAWYVALEQGRDVRPSDQVVESLSLALRLTPAERQHLFLLSRPGTQTGGPEEEVPGEEAGEAVRAAVLGMDPHPAYVMGRRWDLLTWNRSAELVFGFSEIAPPHRHNVLWRAFTHPLFRAHPDWDRLGQSLVAQFRLDYAARPGDQAFERLISDLKAISGEFVRWWSLHDVRSIPHGPKRLRHPSLGTLEFEHVTLRVPERPEQKVVIYTCHPHTARTLSAALQEAAAEPASPGSGRPAVP